MITFPPRSVIVSETVLLRVGEPTPQQSANSGRKAGEKVQLPRPVVQNLEFFVQIPHTKAYREKKEYGNSILKNLPIAHLLPPLETIFDRYAKLE